MEELEQEQEEARAEVIDHQLEVTSAQDGEYLELQLSTGIDIQSTNLNPV